MRPTLYIGNKNYSSWSLRPWLALRWAGIDFDVKTVELGTPEYGVSKIPAVVAVSPTGLVPVLTVSDRTIPESLAIAEWAADMAPEAELWPVDPLERAMARSAACEMHAGFVSLRRAMPMNIRGRGPARVWSDTVRADIARVTESWKTLLARSGGPFLFGKRTIADAMYAPVCTRFRTYGVELDPRVEAYCMTVFNDPGFREWEKDATAEPWSIAPTDAALIPS